MLPITLVIVIDPQSVISSLQTALCPSPYIVPRRCRSTTCCDIPSHARRMGPKYPSQAGSGPHRDWNRPPQPALGVCFNPGRFGNTSTITWNASRVHITPAWRGSTTPCCRGVRVFPLNPPLQADVSFPKNIGDRGGCVFRRRGAHLYSGSESFLGEDGKRIPV